MKYLAVFALLAAVASAAYLKPQPATSEVLELQQLIAAIQSPSSDPATAAALQAMLDEVLGLVPDTVSVVEADPAPIVEGIAAGAPVIDFPLPDGGEVTAVDAAPAVVAESAAASPLVQIILNINSADASTAPVDTAPPPVSVVETPVAAVSLPDTLN